MRKGLYYRGLALFLVGCTLLSCASCGGAKAATMHLRKTEGTVGVSDSEGKGVELRENLGLYSGYGVGTEATSYAWIDLDKVKLTKLDENSEVGIKKEDKHLTIEVKSGSLFFNVTEPLADDETMEIRTSSMMVGIRGTCGWVEVPDENTMKVFLLEGKVECSAGGETAAVNAGEMAKMSGDGKITLEHFSVSSIPAFVRAELEEDESLVKQIKTDSGIDINTGVPGNIPRPSAYTEYWNDETTPNGRWEFTYEEGGRVRIDSYQWKNGAWISHSSSYLEVVYNVQGREQELRTYNLQGELGQHIVLTENAEDHAVYTAIVQFEYHAAGYTEYFNEQGQKIRREYDGGGEVTFEYDDQGRLSRTTIRPGNNTVAYHIFEYGAS